MNKEREPNLCGWARATVAGAYGADRGQTIRGQYPDEVCNGRAPVQLS